MGVGLAVWSRLGARNRVQSTSRARCKAATIPVAMHEVRRFRRGGTIESCRAGRRAGGGARSGMPARARHLLPRTSLRPRWVPAARRRRARSSAGRARHDGCPEYPAHNIPGLFPNSSEEIATGCDWIASGCDPISDWLRPEMCLLRRLGLRLVLREKVLGFEAEALQPLPGVVLLAIPAFGVR